MSGDVQLKRQSHAQTLHPTFAKAASTPAIFRYWFSMERYVTLRSNNIRIRSSQLRVNRKRRDDSLHWGMDPTVASQGANWCLDPLLTRLLGLRLN